MKTYDELKEFFLMANEMFLKQDISLLNSQVSERTLCGALMNHMNCLMAKSGEYEGYHTDVEYNRNGGKLKAIKKTEKGTCEQIINITCDLIMHSRGTNVMQDNLIALEMKKSTARFSEKQSDKERLIALTKDSFDEIWSFDGTALPEYVCRYLIGIYYEINFSRKEIFLEYYKQGECKGHQTLNF